MDDSTISHLEAVPLSSFPQEVRLHPLTILRFKLACYETIIIEIPVSTLINAVFLCLCCTTIDLNIKENQIGIASWIYENIILNDNKLVIRKLPGILFIFLFFLF